MAAKRIVPCLGVKNGRGVEPTRFGGWEDLGHPAEIACRLELEGADAILFRDLDGSRRAGRESWISEVAHALSIPFLVGGVIREMADVETWMTRGADAVVLDPAVMDTPELIPQVSERYGKAAAWVGLEVEPDPRHRWRLAPEDGCAGAPPREALAWAEEAMTLGAGGLLLHMPSRSGRGLGFDLELVQEVARLSTPLLVAGGAGSETHVLEALECGADGVVAASLFHRLRVSPASLKSFLAGHGMTVRH